MDQTPPKINRHINATSDSSLSETPMDTNVPNGYKETRATNEAKTELTAESEEKLFKSLVKVVKDNLNTSTLSLAEFKKLLHPIGECWGLRGRKVKELGMFGRF